MYYHDWQNQLFKEKSFQVELESTFKKVKSFDHQKVRKKRAAHTYYGGFHLYFFPFKFPFIYISI